jgi:flagellar hook-basal body complex protein FliE
MTDINTSNLIDQMRQMIAQAEGADLKVNVPGPESFGTVFQQALNQVNELGQNADDLTKRFKLGDPNVSLADTMIATQKANLGFQGALTVRNKLVQAYQDIMNMPV